MRSPSLISLLLSIALLCSRDLVSAAQTLDLKLDLDRFEEAFEGSYHSNEDDFFHFISRPDIRAPRWNVEVYKNDSLAPGYWFVSPYASLGQKERGEAWVGPYIYDGAGELIWSGVPMFDSFNIFDFRPVEIAGKQMFTAIYKRENAGIIADSSYQIHKMVRWPGGYDASNMHEFTTFDEGSKALVFTHETHLLNRKQSQKLDFDGECLINTNGVLELDISSSQPVTLFNWSLIEHSGLDETTYPAIRNRDRVDKQCIGGWDFHHCNAIDHFDSGDILISCRYTDALYKISRTTGEIIWRLGGVKSDFKFIGHAKFSRQHHARVLEANNTHTIISIFDNARSEGIQTSSSNYTRGLILSLHDDVAEVVAEYPRPDYGYSTSRGSLQVLPNENIFMGWTFHSRISEHLPDGTLLMQAMLPPHKNTYRSYKSTWVGRPINPPDVWSNAMFGGSRDEIWTEVYVSWNGATDIDRWTFFECNSQGSQRELLRSVPRTGFETFSEFDRHIPFLIAEAIDIHGKPIGQSKVITTVPPERNAKNFLQEQEWQREHLPSSIDASAPASIHDISDSQSSQWDVKWQESELLAYLAGLLTCFVVFVLFWVGPRFMRRRKAKGYERVVDDDEKVFERVEFTDIEPDEKLESAREKVGNEPG